MRTLILDARIICDLALNRQSTHKAVTSIINWLSCDYELKVSSLVKDRLECLLGVEKAQDIINCFSDFFFEIDSDLIQSIREINVKDHYSAVEAAYAQMYGDTFIVTTCPESFEGSGLVVYEAENLKFAEEKLFLEKLFLLEVDGLKSQEELESVTSPLKFDLTQNTSGKFLAPFIPITILNPVNQKSMLVNGFIDTGAEVTLVPSKLLNVIGVHACGKNSLYGIGGQSYAYKYFVCLSMASHEYNFHSSVYGWEKDFAIIGRDLLGQLRVVIDGPQGHVLLLD
jgi:Retroviral aspartyl protease